MRITTQGPIYATKLLTAFLAVFLITSCSSDDGDDVKKGFTEPPVAAFLPAVNPNDYKEVTFSNTSERAESYLWDFGDGTTSDKENPTHGYENPGTYTVTLTATNNIDSDEATAEIELVNPNAKRDIITGETSKTWKLIRDDATYQYGVMLGRELEEGGSPWAAWDAAAKEQGDAVYDSYWTYFKWAIGHGEHLEGKGSFFTNRLCMANDEFIFHEDGTYEFDDKGDTFSEAAFRNDLDFMCIETTPENMVGDLNEGDEYTGAGEDLSAWASGTHEFVFDPVSDELTVKGLGAFVGTHVVGQEVQPPLLPETSITYRVTKLVEAEVDTMYLEVDVVETSNSTPTYVRFVLVHYDDPADEPALP